MRDRKKTLAVGAAIAGFAALAHAVPLSFSFGGLVTQVDPALSAIASVGEAFTGSYSFDSGAQDVLPALPKIGGYALQSFDLHIGGRDYQWSGGLGGITVSNLAVDAFDVAVAGLSGPGSNGYAPRGAGFSLRDATGTAFANDGLPLTAPRLDDFGSSPFIISFGRGPLGTKPITGRITELAPITAAVPEPQSYALMAAGLGMLAAVGRRKKKAA
jgi:hypothetical protein